MLSSAYAALWPAVRAASCTPACIMHAAACTSVHPCPRCISSQRAEARDSIGLDAGSLKLVRPVELMLVGLSCGLLGQSTQEIDLGSPLLAPAELQTMDPHAGNLTFLTAPLASGMPATPAAIDVFTNSQLPVLSASLQTLSLSSPALTGRCGAITGGLWAQCSSSPRGPSCSAPAPTRSTCCPARASPSPPSTLAPSH